MEHTNRIVLGRVFMVVSLKGTVILSAVKENATMKWTFGIQCKQEEADCSIWQDSVLL